PQPLSPAGEGRMMSPSTVLSGAAALRNRFPKNHGKKLWQRAAGKIESRLHGDSGPVSAARLAASSRLDRSGFFFERSMTRFIFAIPLMLAGIDTAAMTYHAGGPARCHGCHAFAGLEVSQRTVTRHRESMPEHREGWRCSCFRGAIARFSAFAQ